MEKPVVSEEGSEEGSVQELAFKHAGERWERVHSLGLRDRSRNSKVTT